MKYVVLGSVLMLAACGGRYVGWENVRIEPEVPSPDCRRIIQESCSKAGDECYIWYKQRATIHQANTVVVLESSNGQQGSSGAPWGGWGGWGRGSSRPALTMLADYYACPAN
jgi:hypothetical protein